LTSPTTFTIHAQEEEGPRECAFERQGVPAGEARATENDDEPVPARAQEGESNVVEAVGVQVADSLTIVE
jgi:hypothetical protein